MNDPDHARDIERLKAELDELNAKRAQLFDEIFHLVAQIPENRRKFGNPFYYSHPEEPDEGIANYNPNAVDEHGWTTWRSLRRVERELERIRAELRRLEDDATSH
jgi:hypothetical protein